jgi:hypothetical protein
VVHRCLARATLHVLVVVPCGSQVSSTSYPTVLVLPEHNLVKVEGILDDAGGGHTRPQDVLLRRHVVRLSHPVQVGQETGTEPRCHIRAAAGTEPAILNNYRCRGCLTSNLANKQC